MVPSRASKIGRRKPTHRLLVGKQERKTIAVPFGQTDLLLSPGEDPGAVLQAGEFVMDGECTQLVSERVAFEYGSHRYGFLVQTEIILHDVVLGTLLHGLNS